MTKARRVKRIDVNPPIVYDSIVLAAQLNGVNEDRLRRWLGRGYTPFGIYEPLDPQNNGVTISVNGKEYPSIREAAKQEGFSKDLVTSKIYKGLKSFTIKGKTCIITDDYIP